MVTAMPKLKPRSTGREMKLASPPARARPAMRKNAPAARTAAAVMAADCAGRPCIEISKAPRIAADEEVGATMAKRLRPQAA